MNIKVIGCGNAFSKINFNQCFLLTEEFEGTERKMLIDAGSRIPLALDYHNISIFDIDDIYISHQHADHIGGLEEFAFTTYDWINKPVNGADWKKNGKKRIRLIANENLLEDTWNTSLKGRLSSMEGFPASLETFFEPYPIKANHSFEWQGWECTLIQQVHVMTGNMIMSTFGLVMKKEGHDTVYFTMDSQHCSPKQIELFYKNADVIIQDCELTGIDIINENVCFESGVHANFGQLAGFESSNSVKLSDKIKNKMWLSHYQDFVSQGVDFSGNPVDWDEYADKYGFRGRGLVTI